MAKKKSKAAPKPEKPMPGDLVGRTIARVRKMTAEELGSEGWEVGRHATPVVLVLDDGTKLYSSSDEEGNGPGVLFGVDKTGLNFMVCEQSI